MRNLKRVLSLALALVMILGMMVMGAGAASADFSDGAEIDYVEAVDVISGLGVMIGSDDNGDGVYEFEADDYLTRAETAKVMCYILMGGANAEKLPKNESVFKDVTAGSWAAGFISYCNTLEIMVGDGKGNFDPTGTLTGVQFAKMLLVAAGYDPNAEGYAYDKNWAANIGVDAIANGIDLDGVALADPITREQAAQMIFQALGMKTVKYTTSYDYATGTQVKVGPKTTSVTFAGKYFSKLDQTDAGNDKWGRPYDYKWVLLNNKGAVDKTLYTAWEAPAAVYTEAVSDCDIAKAMGMKQDGNITAYINGVEDTTYPIDVSAQAKNNGAQGTLIEVYEDEIVVIDTYLAQVTKVTEEKTDKNGHVIVDAESDIVVWFDAEGTPDEIAKETSYAEDTMILVNYNEEYDFYEIVGEADSIVSYQSAYTTKASHILGDDKTEYSDAANFWLDEAVDSTDNYTWYFDQYDNLIGAVELPADPSTYGTITSIYWKDSFDGEDGYAVTKITYMDGTSETLKVTKIDTTVLEGIEGNYANYAEGDVSSTKNYNKAEFTNKALYEVKTDKNGTTLTTMAYLEGATTETGVPALTDDVDAGNATMFLVWTGKAYETYTGIKKVPTYVSGEFWYVDEDDNGVVEYVFAIEPAGKDAGTSTLTYFWNGDLTVTTYLKNSSKEYYVISGGYVDGVENTIKTKDADLKDQIVNELSCKLLVLTEKSGYITAAETVTENDVKVDSLGAYVVYAGVSTVDKVHDVLVDENGNSYDVESIEKIACDHEDVDADYLYIVYKMGTKGTKIASLIYYTCTEGDPAPETPAPETPAYDAAVAAAKAALEAETKVEADLTDAKAALAALTGLTDEQAAYVEDLIADIDDALAEIAEDELEDAIDAAEALVAETYADQATAYYAYLDAVAAEEQAATAVEEAAAAVTTAAEELAAAQFSYDVAEAKVEAAETEKAEAYDAWLAAAVAGDDTTELEAAYDAAVAALAAAEEDLAEAQAELTAKQTAKAEADADKTAADTAKAEAPAATAAALEAYQTAVEAYEEALAALEALQG